MSFPKLFLSENLEACVLRILFSCFPWVPAFLPSCIGVTPGLLTPAVWVFPTPADFLTPAEGPTYNSVRFWHYPPRVSVVPPLQTSTASPRCQGVRLRLTGMLNH